MHYPTKTDPVSALFGEVISTYSRAQALEDGVLVDAGEMTREAGFLWPVAIRSTLEALRTLRVGERPKVCRDRQGSLEFD